MDFNFREIMKRVLKYLVEAMVVALACYAIPKKKLDLEEVALIALVAAATFSILDTYIPRL
jgi:ABC-type Co2+ transport system permease subunit